MDTTNLRQIEGGTVIKQADRSSILSFILQDAKGREVKLDGQAAQVALYTNIGKYWETTSTVKGAEVSFSLPGNLAVDDYLLDISVGGYVFPSDRDLIIKVTQGFRNLPDKETAERSERTLEEITADVQKQADEKLKQTITIITKKKDTFTSYVDTKTSEVSSTGDKYLKDIEATTSQAKTGIIEVAKLEGDKLTASSTEAISLIGSKKDQALKEIGSKAKTIADTVKSDVASLLKDYVGKEPGKGLSDNNFSDRYKSKLDNLDTDIDKKLEPKADKTMLDDDVQKLKDLIFDSETKYQGDMIYTLDSVIENGEVKVKAKEIGKLVANDFLRVNVDSDKYKFRIKSTSQGVILFYSMTDDALRYAIHVFPQIKDYEIDFGKKVTGEMIFTSVTMPEDKVSVIREEGL
ncbi:hypothetical protein [Anaerococcus tetradius]|uniref:BppU N-terminal domain-containing protein n=1 Tax=Anaerococcus tetradius ATCC 35098 TaxID=525255 RepID=C2CFW1_9FIRM|nr:hypothetical protein [Anaerococcus tetradius]EEI83489.1 hypothetical protein HMPREF0077_0371 [Anaerococcus tetradius ATCC 35098]